MRCFPLILSMLVPVLLSAQVAPTRKELKARAFNDNGKPYKAIALCNDHLMLKNVEPPFYVIRAEANNMIGEHGKAAEDARQALSYAPASTEALLQLAIAEQGMGRNDSAVVHLRQVLERDPNGEAYVRMALAHQQLRDHQAALADLDEAQRSKDTIDLARLERIRGECHAMLGDSARSRAAFDSALAISPRDPVIWNSRGFHRYATFGEHARALQDYDQAIKLNPNYSYAFNYRGWSLYKLGDTDKALQNITLAERKKANNPYVYRNLGVIKIEQGDTVGGCASLRMALDLGFTDLFGPEVQDLVALHCPIVPKAAPVNAPAPLPPAKAPSNAPGSAPVKRNNAP
jgi:tetratricopeptide (TPR) repeat protein